MTPKEKVTNTEVWGTNRPSNVAITRDDGHGTTSSSYLLQHLLCGPLLRLVGTKSVSLQEVFLSSVQESRKCPTFLNNTMVNRNCLSSFLKKVRPNNNTLLRNPALYCNLGTIQGALNSSWVFVSDQHRKFCLFVYQSDENEPQSFITRIFSLSIKWIICCKNLWWLS